MCKILAQIIECKVYAPYELSISIRNSIMV